MLERLTGPDQVARVVGAAEQIPMEASVSVRREREGERGRGDKEGNR